MTVEQNVGVYACPTAFRKGLRQLARYRTVFIEILSKRDSGFRPFYVAQHGGEGLIAVEQNFDVIPAHDRRVSVGFNGGKKSRFAEGNLRSSCYREDIGAAQKEAEYGEYPVAAFHCV